MQAELNSGSLQIPEPADFVTIGRAPHYLEPEALLQFLRSSTEIGQSFDMQLGHHGTTPWAGESNRLIATYVA